MQIQAQGEEFLMQGNQQPEEPQQLIRPRLPLQAIEGQGNGPHQIIPAVAAGVPPERENLEQGEPGANFNQQELVPGRAGDPQQHVDDIEEKKSKDYYIIILMIYFTKNYNYSRTYDTSIYIDTLQQLTYFIYILQLFT